MLSNTTTVKNSTIWLDHDVTVSLAPVLLTGLRTGFITVISIAIILSNLINVNVLGRTQQIPSISKIFLTNLGIADIGVGLLTCLPCIIPAATGVWPYGAVWCQIAGILHGTSVTVSIWTIAVVSIDRFFAVTFPLKYKNRLNRKKCFLIIGCVWTAAFITFLSPIFTKKDFTYYKYSYGSSMCGMYWENIYLCIVTGVYILILSESIILFTTISIACVLKRARPTRDRVVPTTIHTRNVKAVKVLITTTAVFFTLWGPYVAMVYFTAAHNVVLPLWLEFVLTWLANSNSFVNVLIYSANYDAFRQEAKALVLSIFRCRCFRRNPENRQTSNDYNTARYAS